MTLSWFRSEHCANDRLNRLRKDLDEWPLEAGLFSLEDRFEEYAAAELQAAWQERHGKDVLDAITRREELARMRDAALDARAASARWGTAADRCVSGIAASTSFRQAAWSVAFVAGVWGLSHGELDAVSWAKLALIAALVIINLRAVVPMLGFGVRLPLLLSRSAIEALRRQATRRELLVCERQRSHAERHRSERDAWCATELRALMAAYHHRKELATRAAQAA